MTYKKIVLFILLSMPVLASSENTGGWISSGGESFYDAKNSWFLKGKSVTYCIDIDSNGITTPKEKAVKAVQNAIGYWQKEFSKKNFFSGTNRYKGFELGDNKFSLNPQLRCNGGEDLRILLGSNSLNKKEKSYLKEGVRSYIGVAVRTEYDRKNLQGKGFIFISSDIGPDKHISRKGSINSPWKYPKLLSWSLVHELGHVFGIPHTGTSFMSEIFMDILLSKYHYKDFINYDFEPFLATPAKLNICNLDIATRVFLKMDVKETCLEVLWESSKNITVNATTLSGDKQKIASIKGLKIDIFNTFSKPISYLRLSDKQEIFSPDEVNFRSLVPGPLREILNMNGKIIIEKNFSSHPIYLEVTPEKIVFSSIVNNKIKNVLFYSSPITSTFSQLLELSHD